MKKMFVIIVLLLIMLLNACSSSEKNISDNNNTNSLESKVDTAGMLTPTSTIEDKETPIENDDTTTTENNTLSENIYNSTVGQYMYQGSSENKYIVLEENNSNITGKYYGTTDDFDQAREGYLPGYFVVEMKNLLIENNEISFYIELTENDLFDKVIDLNIKSSSEISLTENPRWKQTSGGFNKERDGNIEYTALIKNNKLELRLPSIYSEDPYIFEKQN
jgi:hypothetical protein